MKKQVLFFAIAFFLCTFSFSSTASLYVCQKGTCSYIHEEVSLLPWVKKIYPFFKTSNARIDFCEADSKEHFCLAEGLNWYARSPVTTSFFSIPVARTIPHKKTLLLDYLVRANIFLPSCSFALTTLEEADNKTIRMVSHKFSCDVNDFGKTYLQTTFFIDYIDFDNMILGAKYMIQTHGELDGKAAGYTLMKFRDGKTLLPLVVEPYHGESPAVPDSTEMARLMNKIDNPTYIPNIDGQGPHPLQQEISDWWFELKQSFNLDKPSPKTVPEDAHWWTKFTHKFMKVLYFEPLE